MNFSAKSGSPVMFSIIFTKESGPLASSFASTFTSCIAVCAFTMPEFGRWVAGAGVFAAVFATAILFCSLIFIISLCGFVVNFLRV